jgi:ribosomal protein S18 acetylase RimI-like enzyme
MPAPDPVIRPASPDDAPAIHVLLPRLAAFGPPPPRRPDELWAGDAELLTAWASGRAPDVRVHVALDATGTIVGVAMTRLRPEPLSHAPSAHLEVLALAAHAEGQGLGRALVDAAEATARDEGATSMTLHVFAVNHRARALYARLGYTEEILRAIKFLPPRD